MKTTLNKQKLGYLQMKNKKNYLWIISVLVLILVIWLQAQEIEFYDSNFDGAWAGSILLKTEFGKRNFPLILNMNSQTKKGIGYLQLANDLTNAPNGFELLKLINISPKALSLTAEADTLGEKTYRHKWLLKYKKAKGVMKGTFTSTDPDLKKGKITLYPQSKNKVIQKVWQGTIKINKIKTPIILQLIQKKALGDEVSVTTISGFGFLAKEYGKIKNGSFDGVKFTGDLALANETVMLNLDVKSGILVGSLTGFTFSGKSTLKPIGTSGKSLDVKSVTPTQLTAGESNIVTFVGKNFFPGAMAFIDNSKIQVDYVEFIAKNKIMANLILASDIQTDQKISARIMNINGDFVDMSDAFTIKMKENPITVSFNEDIQPVFNQSCAVTGCHAGGAPAGNLNLSSGAAYGNIVFQASSQRPSLNLITPLNVEESYLIRKLKGDGIAGGQMPYLRDPLAIEIITLFENWVLKGANNN